MWEVAAMLNVKHSFLHRVYTDFCFVCGWGGEGGEGGDRGGGGTLPCLGAGRTLLCQGKGDHAP